MAFIFTLQHLTQSLIALFLVINSVLATRQLTDTTMLFTYHNGPLLTGQIPINLIWYGDFKPSQRAIISDFVTSLSSTTQPETSPPSVASWWNSVGKYYALTKRNKDKKPILTLGKEIIDASYTIGKSLSTQQLEILASKAAYQQTNAINIVLTSADVSVEGFCSSRCGTHGSLKGGSKATSKYKTTYIWVGNSESQCPGQCAWPFHQPIYGPQGPPLVAPNNDVGMDGMVINLASLLAGTVTNPFGNGYFQGPKGAGLEAASACTGVYGKGAYPGYAGQLLVDGSSGGSYNANGVNGRKYLLPALYDPTTSSCSTLV